MATGDIVVLSDIKKLNNNDGVIDTCAENDCLWAVHWDGVVKDMPLIPRSEQTLTSQGRPTEKQHNPWQVGFW